MRHNSIWKAANGSDTQRYRDGADIFSWRVGTIESLSDVQSSLDSKLNHTLKALITSAQRTAAADKLGGMVEDIRDALMEYQLIFRVLGSPFMSDTVTARSLLQEANVRAFERSCLSNLLSLADITSFTDAKKCSKVISVSAMIFEAGSLN